MVLVEHFKTWAWKGLVIHLYFVKDLRGALLHNYVGNCVVIIEVEGLSNMIVFWNHKQGL
jgi:hypothetical protein